MGRWRAADSSAEACLRPGPTGTGAFLRCASGRSLYVVRKERTDFLPSGDELGAHLSLPKRRILLNSNCDAFQVGDADLQWNQTCLPLLWIPSTLRPSGWSLVSWQPAPDHPFRIYILERTTVQSQTEGVTLPWITFILPSNISRTFYQTFFGSILMHHGCQSLKLTGLNYPEACCW